MTAQIRSPCLLTCTVHGELDLTIPFPWGSFICVSGFSSLSDCQTFASADHLVIQDLVIQDWLNQKPDIRLLFVVHQLQTCSPTYNINTQ